MKLDTADGLSRVKRDTCYIGLRRWLLCVFSVSYTVPTQQRNQAPIGTSSINTGLESPHSPVLHPAEGCGRSGSISFGWCSECKHRLLIRPSDWDEARRKEKSNRVLMETRMTDRQQKTLVQATSLHETIHNLTDFVLNCVKYQMLHLTLMFLLLPDWYSTTILWSEESMMRHKVFYILKQNSK